MSSDMAASPQQEPGEALLPLAYTRRDTARLLCISTNSLDRLAAQGLIQPNRALRRPLYSAKEIQRFLESRTDDKVQGAANNPDHYIQKLEGFLVQLATACPEKHWPTLSDALKQFAEGLIPQTNSLKQL